MVEPFNTLNAIFNSIGVPYYSWINGISRKPTEIFISGANNKANYDVTYITIYSNAPGIYYTQNGVYIGYFDSVDTLYASNFYNNNSFTKTIYDRYYNVLSSTYVLSPTVSTVIYTDDEYSESRVKGKKIKSLKEKLKKVKRKLKKLKEKKKKEKKTGKSKKNDDSSSSSSSDE